MKMSGSGGETVLCISTSEQGQALLSELARLGCRVVLLTIEEHHNADWPRDILVDLHTMPGGMTLQQIINTVSYLARSQRFARILPLDEPSMETAAVLREHLRIPGMGITTTHSFRDRLAMRMKAAHSGMRAAAFTPIVNYDDIRAFMEKVPAPWLLTPRSELFPGPIQQLHDSDEVWRALEELGDGQSYFFLEQSISGDFFHVDSITAAGQVVFAAVEASGDTSGSGSQSSDGSPARPISCALAQQDDLKRANAKLLERLGLVRGIARSKFIRSHATGEFYFLETSANVGDASTVVKIEQAHDLNVWVEWARLEVAAMRGQTYALPKKNTAPTIAAPEPQSVSIDTASID